MRRRSPPSLPRRPPLGLLTGLYNERPAWLDHAHRDLDAAVAAAYDWPADIPDEDTLARLLELDESQRAK